MKKTVVEKHFDSVAADYDLYKKRNTFYYENLKRLLKKLISVNKNVLEIGCGTGDLLASLNPKNGYGVDLSSSMIKIAKRKHLKLKFSTSWPTGKFDYIFMSDVIEHLEKPKETLIKIKKLMNNKTVFINTMANPLWEPLLMVWEVLGLKMPEGPHYRIKNYELRVMMEKVGLKIIKHDYKLLIPIQIPFITNFANRYLEKYFKKFAFIEYFVATLA